VSFVAFDGFNRLFQLFSKPLLLHVREDAWTGKGNEKIFK